MPDAAQPMPPWGDDVAEPDTSTVALLYQRFGDVLVDLDSIRRAYFRNLSPDRFRRALREQRIPLPIVRLDRSAKAQPFISIYHMAALIEARQIDSLADAPPHIADRMRQATPITAFPPAAAGE
ncbi:pyocin activator PrtN family protein [Aidingimonas halophila]|uniref:Pyocin activator protein PrtN n=1 Tax=Aidingimonas halophila TaxID=574349 RepID=A0A1H2RGS1_9GAMM|nr:pyocin activator PrtN family protein [Aidingimonas halophila]GHC19266.1 hypothetical protein GCM10008094_06550 [Aidingimonas halophila]SDW18485.1 Pyocin activator protein PrtN [Aidingimonas halophila]